ncbi:hypothetical protein EG68_07570 [Paragonimus skrjabini miyazakii]|uniref:Protein kinase domain-containing protein n=1 Tax=Paragonimus skrjabini miyazakii TaxID=59628 RepID=A0A8S9YIX7_9TREM|nr:hypothetical protein EG68_07570 [Paragonimus skrjabini miyazakii]
MIVALIVDDNVANTPGNELRKKSVEEVKLACERANAELTIVPYEGVAQNKADFLDRVYNSDVLILDMSVKIQQGVLLYTLSVRETMKLFDNIVLVTFPPGKTTEEVARLRAMRRRLDDPELLSPEILLNMLLSYRECEDYKSMVKLIDDVRSLRIPSASVDSDVFTYYYAFALNGRRLKGDREKALQKITELLKTSKNPSADMYGLLGRIHKDRFLESQYKDEEALQLAIESYRNGFKSVPNEYLGVNLATLLVCSGQDLSSSLELRTVCNTLNRRMGLKGDVSKLTDYWDLATLFEIRVLSEEYFSAVDVLDKMFSMEPPAWQLSSTMRNINLICHFRRRLPLNSRTRRSRKLFDFWTEFLADVDRSDCNVTKTDASSTVHCVRQDDDHVFYLEDIKGISMTKQRSVYLFTVFYSLDFTFKFSCENVREQFCSVVRDQFLSEEQLGDLVLEDSSTAPLEFEYENDERELGRGSFGVVYVGRLVTSQRKIAIKEIPADDSSQFQEVVEEIRLHSRLAHPNIVCYLGAVLQDGHLKILMELVPGGSLTSLLKKYGPLKEPAVAEYSEQILQGLNYLVR